MEGLPPAAGRWLAAGGSIANLAAAVPAWIALQQLPPHLGPGPCVRLAPAGGRPPHALRLPALLGLGNIGDWAAVVRGLEPPLAWRGALSVAGALLYFRLAPRLLMPPLEQFLGTGAEQRQLRAQTLSVLPYAVGGLTYVAAGVLNPHGHLPGPDLGGRSVVRGNVAPRLVPGRMGAAHAARLGVGSAGRARSRGWLVAAAITLVVFVGVLGPGVRLTAP